MLVSSPTFITAARALAVHTPAEQDTLRVGASRMTSAACAAVAAGIVPPSATIAAINFDENIAPPSFLRWYTETRFQDSATEHRMMQNNAGEDLQ
jgi:hypothetical protein